ncbi:MAG TPA: hypothetical protein VGH28_05150 [Polyangiaceae bacterium]|jgi:hypothetical protein
MSKNTGKLVIAAVLASSGFVAFACGGGSEEGKGTQTPSASGTETATAPASETAAATATATATTPPAPTLPDSFKAADDARKTADGKLSELIAKKNTCTAAATDLTKFTKDNAAAYQTWNGEYSKLDDAQKGLVQTKPMATLNDEMMMFDSGSFKPCIAKKDKKVGTALAGFLSAASKGLPGAAAPAGSASAAPAKK